MALLGGAATWPLSASAQPDRQRLVSVLMAYSEVDPEGQQRLAAFRESLATTGFVEGKNARIEVRWLAGDPDRAKGYAKQVLEQSPDLIVVNGTPGLSEVHKLRSSIPIVFVMVTDPVGAGFVHSHSRPGGNITGFSTFEPEIGGKWLEALKEAAPLIQRVGVLMDTSLAGFQALWLAIKAVAPTVGLRAFPLETRDGADIDQLVERFATEVGGGLIVLPTPINSVQRQRIFLLAAQHRLPAIYPFAFHARDGGLIAYGFDSLDLFRRAGPYVARILNGEKPNDLPVQAPSKFNLVVNLRTARALGLSIPPTLLARADEVIE
jgi:putative tryptophan/tyrosine transport system substrate-binding protein